MDKGTLYLIPLLDDTPGCNVAEFDTYKNGERFDTDSKKELRRKYIDSYYFICYPSVDLYLADIKTKKLR